MGTPRALSSGHCLQAAGLQHFFDVVITPQDTERHKPHAEPLLAALQQFSATVSPQLLAKQALYVGDMNFDSLAAKAAGMDFYHVAWPTELAAGDDVGKIAYATYRAQSFKPLLKLFAR